MTDFVKTTSAFIVERLEKIIENKRNLSFKIQRASKVASYRASFLGQPILVTHSQSFFFTCIALIHIFQI